MLYVPYQGSDRCLHPLPLLPLPQCFALMPHQSTFSLSYWENDVASITLMLILQSFSPASPCFVYQVPYYTKPQKENHSTNLLLKMHDVVYSCSLPVVIFLFQKPHHATPRASVIVHHLVINAVAL